MSETEHYQNNLSSDTSEKLSEPSEYIPSLDRCKQTEGGVSAFRDVVKSSDKYSLLARFGLYHVCSLACLDLRRKLSSSGFEAVSRLHRRFDYDILDYEKEMVDRLLGKDTEDRGYYRSWSGI